MSLDYIRERERERERDDIVCIISDRQQSNYGKGKRCYTLYYIILFVLFYNTKKKLTIERERERESREWKSDESNKLKIFFLPLYKKRSLILVVLSQRKQKSNRIDDFFRDDYIYIYIFIVIDNEVNICEYSVTNIVNLAWSWSCSWGVTNLHHSQFH